MQTHQMKRDGGLETPLEWDMGVKLKGNILIIFPKVYLWDMYLC